MSVLTPTQSHHNHNASVLTHKQSKKSITKKDLITNEEEVELENKVEAKEEKENVEKESLFPKIS
jgi:hypothetical protein